MKHILLTISLLFCMTANAAYIVESSPGVVTGIGDLDIGGTLYNVDFEAIGGVFSTFGGSEFFWGDGSSALAAASAVNNELSEAGAAVLNNKGTSPTSDIVAGFYVWSAPDILTAGVLSASRPSWFTFIFPEQEFSYSGFLPGLGTAWSVAEVPLPAAAWLFGSALLGLGVVKRKKA